MANIGDESNHACKTGSGGKGLMNVDRLRLGENLRHPACLENRTAVVSYLTVYTHQPPKTWTPYGGVRCVRTYRVLLAIKKRWFSWSASRRMLGLRPPHPHMIVVFSFEGCQWPIEPLAIGCTFICVSMLFLSLYV
jgi:hypothetical protein